MGSELWDLLVDDERDCGAANLGKLAAEHSIGHRSPVQERLV
jgi:hypothetical protein